VCTVGGCGAAFGDSSHLADHGRVHDGVRRYVCGCGAAFSHGSGLKDHERTHTKDRPWVCLCGATFAQSSTLRAHERMHRGEKRHVCDVCERGFLRSDHLLEHRARMHDIGKYRCDYCFGNCAFRRALEDEKLGATVQVCRKCYKRATGVSERRWGEYLDEHRLG
jgi:uncharacterized Zn-finger protein